MGKPEAVGRRRGHVQPEAARHNVATGRISKAKEQTTAVGEVALRQLREFVASRVEMESDRLGSLVNRVSVGSSASQSDVAGSSSADVQEDFKQTMHSHLNMIKTIVETELDACREGLGTSNLIDAVQTFFGIYLNILGKVSGQTEIMSRRFSQTCALFQETMFNPVLVVMQRFKEEEGTELIEMFLDVWGKEYETKEAQIDELTSLLNTDCVDYDADIRVPISEETPKLEEAIKSSTPEELNRVIQAIATINSEVLRAIQTLRAIELPT